jgi:hypothetical protein
MSTCRFARRDAASPSLSQVPISETNLAVGRSYTKTEAARTRAVNSNNLTYFNVGNSNDLGGYRKEFRHTFLASPVLS